jgi:hypothetical protein
MDLPSAWQMNGENQTSMQHLQNDICREVEIFPMMDRNGRLVEKISIALFRSMFMRLSGILPGIDCGEIKPL